MGLHTSQLEPLGGLVGLGNPCSQQAGCLQRPHHSRFPAHLRARFGLCIPDCVRQREAALSISVIHLDRQPRCCNVNVRGSRGAAADHVFTRGRDEVHLRRCHTQINHQGLTDRWVESIPGSLAGGRVRAWVCVIHSSSMACAVVSPARLQVAAPR